MNCATEGLKVVRSEVRLREQSVLQSCKILGFPGCEEV